MNNNFKYLFILISLTTLVYCKSTKLNSVEYSPSIKQLEIANIKWANTLPLELKQGQNIFSTKCIECHKSKTIVNYNEKKWIRIIDEMSEKSKLSVEEKLKLTKYILSYRQEKTIINSN